MLNIINQVTGLFDSKKAQPENTTGWMPLMAKDSGMFIPLDVFSAEEQTGIIEGSDEGYNIDINPNNVLQKPLPPTMMDPQFRKYDFEHRISSGILMFDLVEKDLKTAIAEDIGRVTAAIGQEHLDEKLDDLKNKKFILLNMQEICTKGKKDQVPQDFIDTLDEISLKTPNGAAKPEITFFTLARDPMGFGN